MMELKKRREGTARRDAYVPATHVTVGVPDVDHGVLALYSYTMFALRSHPLWPFAPQLPQRRTFSVIGTRNHAQLRASPAQAPQARPASLCWGNKNHVSAIRWGFARC